MIYSLMEPPFKFDTFEDMTKQQAQQYFDWYISCIPERVALLDECFNSVWGCGIKFDYSTASLDPLWEAFEKHIETREMTKAEMDAQLAQAPEWLHKTLLEDKRDFTQGTLVIAADIGMYYGEVIARNIPGIHWGFLTKPKSMDSVNRPVLMGFGRKMYMNPVRTVVVGCRKSVEGTTSRFLSETLDKWMKLYGSAPE